MHVLLKKSQGILNTSGGLGSAISAGFPRVDQRCNEECVLHGEALPLERAEDPWIAPFLLGLLMQSPEPDQRFFGQRQFQHTLPLHPFVDRRRHCFKVNDEYVGGPTIAIAAPRMSVTGWKNPHCSRAQRSDSFAGAKSDLSVEYGFDFPKRTGPGGLRRDIVNALSGCEVGQHGGDGALHDLIITGCRW